MLWSAFFVMVCGTVTAEKSRSSFHVSVLPSPHFLGQGKGRSGFQTRGLVCSDLLASPRTHGKLSLLLIFFILECYKAWDEKNLLFLAATLASI